MIMGHRRSRFFLNFAVVFSSTYFPFPPSIDKILGDAHWTGTSILACLNTNDAPMHGPCAISTFGPNKKKNPRSTIRNLKAHRIRSVSPKMTQGALLISTSPSSFIYLRLLLSPSPSPFPLSSLSHLHLHRPPNSKKGKRTDQFSALRLLTWKSPNNLSILSGNGKTLKKRRRLN